MNIAEAFQVANVRVSTNQQGRPAPSSPSPDMNESTPTTHQGCTPIHWTDIEWLAVARELIRLYPDLGLPNPDNVGGVRLRHMHAAMQTLPVERRRHLVALTHIRPRLIHFFKQIINGTDAQKARTAFGPLPQSVIYRQPDGAQNGAPPAGKRIFWREPEWYAVAVELAFTDPSLLDTLNHLTPSNVYKAQRVLPTNRRRPQTSFNHAKIRAELAPAFRRVRAAIEAKRTEEAEQRAAAEAEEARRAEDARHAAEMAAQAALREEMAQSPEFVAKALGAAPFGPLLEALFARGAASLQTVLETALVNAFSSDAVKRAMVINLHMDKAESSAQSFAANAPTISGNVAANAVCKPKIGILGALAQQGETLAASYPQLRIKVIDKNLTSGALRDAIANCDRVIAMTSFVPHSVDGIGAKTLGGRYTRVDGGVSSVRRQIDVWLASGALSNAVIQAVEQPTESKGT
jgi:hypothetical protein